MLNLCCNMRIRHKPQIADLIPNKLKCFYMILCSCPSHWSNIGHQFVHLHFIDFSYLNMVVDILRFIFSGGATSEKLMKKFCCLICGKNYMWKESLTRHQRYECGKPPQFQCPKCPHRSRHKQDLKTHVALKHSSVLQENK